MNRTDKHSAKDMFIVTAKTGETAKVQKVLHPLTPGAGKIMSKVYTTHEKRLRTVNRSEFSSDVSEHDSNEPDVDEHDKNEPDMEEGKDDVEIDLKFNPVIKETKNETVLWNPINSNFYNRCNDDDDDNEEDSIQDILVGNDLIQFHDEPNVGQIIVQQGIRNAGDVYLCPFDIADVIEEHVHGSDSDSEQTLVNITDEELQQDVSGDVQDDIVRDPDSHGHAEEAGPSQPRNKIARSAPVKRKPERWIVRQHGGVRKSRRLASVKCRQIIKKIAIQWSTDNEEDDGRDGDDETRVLDNNCETDRNRNVPQVDGNYTLPEGVFSMSDIAYFTTAARDVLLQQPDRAYSLVQYLNLDVPTGDVHHAFLQPPTTGALVRSRILSTSEGQLSSHYGSATVRRPSRWRRRLQRLRGFLDQLARK